MKHLIKILALLVCLLTVFSLCSCEVTKGTDGKDGLSAYELAVENGFEGTLEEWLDSLRGEKGKDGSDGENGQDGKDGQDGLNAPSNLDAAVLANYVVVTEHGVTPNTGADMSTAIQNVINQNPNKTIYFPDGVYTVSKPIKTSAKYDKSVSLLLSNYAEIKASSRWTTNASTAVIMLGAAEADSSVDNPGSNYFLEGGIINGNGRANGVSIDSGLETRVEGVSIKNATIGLHIKNGSLRGSAYADVLNVNITGTSKTGSIGVLIDGCDNTLENMRITGIQIGVKLTGSGNLLRDIHPLVGNVSKLYSGSIGFHNVSGSNWFDVCYSDNFETAFKIDNEEPSSFLNCYSYWWYRNSEHQTGYQIENKIGFHFTQKFNSVIQNSRINFSNNDKTYNAYFVADKDGGTGSILNPLFDNHNDNDTYLDYTMGAK